MKVVQINSCANWGSTGTIAENINRVAASHGWDTFFAYGWSMNPCQSNLIRVGNRFTRTNAIIQARLFDNSGLVCKKQTAELIEQLRKIKPNVIHLHNIHAYYLNYPLLFDYLNTAKIPLVWTLHDCWSFTGHCAHFITSRCEKWKQGCNNCPSKKLYPASWLMNRSEKNYSLKKSIFSRCENLHIITVSKWMENMARESFLNKYDIRTIYNGIDTSKFIIRDAHPRKRIRLLAVASIWTNHKGLKDYYELRKLLPVEKYEMILVGMSEKQIKELPDGIIGKLRTNSVDELIDYYNNSDIVLSLSYGESMGLTPVEGMACGTPAIVYNNTAQPELISPDTGIAVTTGNIGEVKLAIEAIANRGKSSFLKACRERAVSNFNKTERCQDYFSIYESLV